MIDSPVNDVTAKHRQLDAERGMMRDILLQIALSRATDTNAQIDARYPRAAGNICHLAATMPDVPDDLFIQVATLRTLVGELISELITARLYAIHFDILPYASATEFFRSLVTVGRGGSSRRLN